MLVWLCLVPDQPSLSCLNSFLTHSWVRDPLFGVHVYVRASGCQPLESDRGQRSHVPVVPGAGETRMSGLKCQKLGP